MKIIKRAALATVMAAVMIAECSCGSLSQNDSVTESKTGSLSQNDSVTESKTGSISESTKESKTGSTAESTARESEASGQERQESSVTVRVQMPEGWEKVSGSVLDVQYLKGTASFLVKEEDFGGANLDDAVKAAEEIFSASFDGYTRSGEPEAISVDEKDARKLTFTCSVSSMKMKYCCIYLYAGDRLFAMTFADLADTFDEIVPDIEQIQENIRFVTS
ncbi:MAG TPA: hypothetical protein PLN48_09040 [Lachnospiraceae bacterium]|jgi:hypothetical protein|nr:hypothetical protein [Lachnospiraceae bacterium]